MSNTVQFKHPLTGFYCLVDGMNGQIIERQAKEFEDVPVIVDVMIIQELSHKELVKLRALCNEEFQRRLDKNLNAQRN